MSSAAPKRIFYGWWLVIVCCITMAVGPILITGTFSIFIKPLAAEFGWSRGDISFGFSLVALMVSFYAPVIGLLIDRFGSRRVILYGSVIFGAGFCSFWFLSASLWQFYASYLLTAFGGACLTSLPFGTTIAGWFIHRRGIALGIMGVGVFLGGMYAPPLVTYVIATAGWRWAYVTLGFAIWIVALPMTGLFFVDAPQKIGLRPYGEGKESLERTSLVAHSVHGRDLTLAEARGTLAFWCMAASFGLLSAVLHGCLTHFAPLLTDKGLSPQQAAVALIVLSGMGVLGRLIAGYLVDRFPPHLVAAGLFLGVVVGLFASFHASDMRFALLFAAMAGLGFGAETDVMPYLIGHHFGVTSLGKIFGWIYGAFAFGGMIGPFLMGRSFDATGSYHLALSILIPATVLGAGLMLPLGWGNDMLKVKSAELQA